MIGNSCGQKRSWLAIVSAALASLIATGAVAQPCVTTSNVTAAIAGTAPTNSFVDMQWDPAGGRIMVFVGCPDDRAGAHVVSYNGTTWTRLPNGGTRPPGEGHSGVWVWDSTRGHGLLFGGAPGTYSASLGSWSFGEETTAMYAYNGSAWQQLSWSGVTPTPSLIIAAVFDPIRGRAIFLQRQGNYPDERYRIWEWTGTAWEQGPVTEHTRFAGFVFDPIRRIALLIGYDNDFQEDMWYYTPGATAADGSWQRIAIATPGQSVVTGAACTYDPFRARVLRCGGLIENPPSAVYSRRVDVWNYDIADWDRVDQSDDLPPNTERWGMAAAYDLNRDTLVMYGGSRSYGVGGGPPSYYRETWEQTRSSPGIASATSGSLAVCEGETALLAVAPVGNVEIRWFKDSLQIPGETGQLLSVGPATAASAGTYHATLYNACGAYAGPETTLRVDPPITFAAPAFWPGCSTCPGSNIVIIPPTLSAASLAGPPLTLRLQKLTAGVWNDLQAVAPGGLFSLSNLQRSQSGDYRILVTGNACPGAVESTHRIEIGVTIDGQPGPQSVAPCAPATFSVQARGTCIQSYQWMRNGTPLANDGRISGATASTLTISGCRYEDEGYYSCLVTDACETRESAAASLLLTTPTWQVAPMNAAPAILSTGSTAYWMSAYDESRGTMVMYGGVTQTGANTNSLWEYDGYAWTVRQNGYPGVVMNAGQPLFDNTFPPNPAASAIVYNPDDHKVYLIATFAWTHPLAICTWDGTSWTRPYYGPVNGDTSRTYAAFDRANHRIVIVRGIGATNNGEMLLYNPATNVMTGPIPMQPQVQFGVSESRLWFDEARGAVLWYTNPNQFVNPTMWYLNGTTWNQVAGTPTRFNYWTQFVYDPVRSQVATMGGYWDGASWYTATHGWPATVPAVVPSIPAASPWSTILPDGPPRNPAGAGISPANNWTPVSWNGMSFDRRRRTMVAPGLEISGPSQVNWKTWERRYLDRVVLDKPAAAVVQAPGNVVEFRSYAAGYPSLAFQWKKNGVNLANGPAAGGGTWSGVQTGVMTLTGATSADNGAYTCVVTNACGSVMTNIVRLGCAADFNNDGVNNVPDVFAFLSAWFANDPSADVNGDGQIAVNDIFAFLSLWFAGC